ncbi:MAG TPA: hypothetical protein ENJ40_02960 [Thermosulfurimonas dismutans]|uniref:Uncharacterized protein n=1 Tax=Thermosulfurimonas dismutans TaxID=999894 RepID=A0A7C3H0G3_9BACT|nr:hypothetical protein [Thermosulfurimonas dismutans]
MKERPTDRLRELEKDLEEALRECCALCLRGAEREKEPEEDISFEPLEIDLLILDLLRWKMRLLKAALKGEDLSEYLDPRKGDLGRFFTNFHPPDETSRTLFEEAQRLYYRLQDEIRGLVADSPDQEEVHARMEERVFPLLGRMRVLLEELSRHLGKGLSGERR